MIIFDILRICAALMVFCIHLFIFVPELPRSVCDILSNGGYGVSVFFVMSGFLIFESLKNSKSLKEYYVKRISRIVPSYYAILVLGIVVWDLVLHQMPADTYAHLGWLRYFLFLNTWIPSAEYGSWNNLWGLWTISCFMFFYLIAPALKKWIRSFERSVVFMIGMIIGTFVLSKVLTLVFTRLGASLPNMLACDIPLYSMNTFAMGICAWYAYREDKVKEYLRIMVLLLVGFVGLNMYNRMLWGVLAALVMMVFIDAGMANKKCESFLKLLGRYSFSLYLVHLPILRILEYMGFGSMMMVALGVICSMAAAVLLYHLVEKPGALLIKKLI